MEVIKKTQKKPDWLPADNLLYLKNEGNRIYSGYISTNNP